MGALWLNTCTSVWLATSPPPTPLVSAFLLSSTLLSLPSCHRSPTFSCACAHARPRVEERQVGPTTIAGVLRKAGRLEERTKDWFDAVHTGGGRAPVHCELSLPLSSPRCFSDRSLRSGRAAIQH